MIAIKVSRLTGFFSAISGIILWIVLTFLNLNHSNIDMEPIIKTSLLLLLPSCLFLISLLLNNGIGLLIATVWFAPAALYFSFTPGIFKLYGIILLLYIISTIFMLVNNINKGDD